MWLPVGLDFGDQSCVIGIYRNGRAEIISNQCSHRLTPTMVTYTNYRRYSGEDSHQRRMENITSTFTNLKRFLSLTYSNPLCNSLKPAMPFELVELPNQLIGMPISFHDRNMTLFPEQCIAFLFKDISNKLIRPNAQTNDYVISVPPHWTEPQRRALLFSIKLSGINCLVLLHSSTAAALCYFKTKGQQFFHHKKRHNVVFIEIGHSSMSAALSQMTRNSIKMVSYSFDSEIGGYHLTSLLANHLVDVIKTQYGVDLTQNKRAYVRFLDAVEKAKRNLTVNKVVPFQIESIMNVDIDLIIERSTFNDLIRKDISRITTLLKNCLKFAKLTKANIDAVEILGGGSRVLAVKEIITDFFQKAPTQSMNLDEYSAMGCTYFGGLLNPANSSDFYINDIIPYDITAHWTEMKKKRQTIIFQINSPLKIESTFNVNIYEENTNIAITSSGQLIGNLLISMEIKAKVPNVITITVVRNRNGLLAFSTKSKTDLFNYKSINQISQHTIDSFLQLEEQMKLSDQNEFAVDQAKNDFDVALFNAEKYIDNFPEDYSKEEFNEVKEAMNKVNLWIEYTEFDHLTADDYHKQIKILKEICDQPYFHKCRVFYKQTVDLMNNIRNDDEVFQSLDEIRQQLESIQTTKVVDEDALDEIASKLLSLSITDDA